MSNEDKPEKLDAEKDGQRSNFQKDHLSLYQHLLNGGSIISRGRVFTSANMPYSYSGAIESGLNFYVDSGPQ